MSGTGEPGTPSDRRSLLRTWLPRGGFVAGAVVLVWVSAIGASLTVLWLAVGLFAACTVVFVARQLRYGHAGDPVRLAQVGGLLMLAGVATFVVYAVSGADALPLVAATLLALGVGWVAEAVRRGRGPAGDRLIRVTALAAAALVLLLLIVLVAVLASTKQSLGSSIELALGGLAVAALVVFVNAASEWALRGLDGATAQLRGRSARSVARIAGLVVVGAVLVVVLVLWSRDWVLTAALVVGVLLLLLALVSSTHADVALILIAVAVLSAAPAEVSPPAPRLDASAHVLVAMGDSYMSGEGADTYYAGTDDAQGDQCRRSPTAYPVITAAAGSPFTQLVFLACSGALTYHVIARSDDPANARTQRGEPDTQTSQLVDLIRRNPGFRPSLVVLSIGGNDAGFGTIAETCLAPGDCSTQRALFVDNLPKVRQALLATYASLRKAVPDVPILVVPYPQPFANATRCDGVLLTRNERVFIHDFVDQPRQHRGVGRTPGGGVVRGGHEGRARQATPAAVRGQEGGGGHQLPGAGVRQRGLHSAVQPDPLAAQQPPSERPRPRRARPGAGRLDHSAPCGADPGHAGLRRTAVVAGGPPGRRRHRADPAVQPDGPESDQLPGARPQLGAEPGARAVAVGGPPAPRARPRLGGQRRDRQLAAQPAGPMSSPILASHIGA